MRNAHERFGILEFTKRMKDTTTHIRLRLDRLVCEIEKERSKIHLLSVLGGDSDVGAIWAAIKDEGFFTVQRPEIEPLTGSLGAEAQCFRGTITIAGRRPNRHLVAVSAEVAKTRPGADREGNRTVYVTTSRRLCCIALRNGSGFQWCRNGPTGSTRNSAGEGQSDR
jgi:hypothetical protein